MSHSNERQCGQHGPGGCRSVLQEAQRWTTSRLSFAASNQKALSGLTAGRGRSAPPDVEPPDVEPVETPDGGGAR